MHHLSSQAAVAKYRAAVMQEMDRVEQDGSVTVSTCLAFGKALVLLTAELALLKAKRCLEQSLTPSEPTCRPR